MDAPYLKIHGLHKLRKWADQLTRAANANKVVSGLGVDVSESDLGRVIDARLAPAGVIACLCEATELTVKTADCTGTKLKHYCHRALQYTRDGSTGALSNRITSSARSSDDISCEVVSDGTNWFFVPTAEQVTTWLAAMTTPPPSSGTYRVTMFFQCLRGVSLTWDEKWAPCGDETSSKVVLFGICYGND